MDGTIIAAIAVVVLIGLLAGAPLYFSSRRTRKIDDPTTRAAAERAEEEVWRLRQRNPNRL
jgi:hypothetical protein